MLETKYEEYERLQKKKLLMEQMNLTSTQEVEDAIKADMLSFAEYMTTHTEEFLQDQIQAYSDYNTAFKTFLDDYKKTQEELEKINMSEPDTIDASNYINTNDSYLDTSTSTIEKEKVEQTLEQIVINDQKLNGTVRGTDENTYDSNGYVDYARAIEKNLENGDVYQAGYDLALRQAKLAYVQNTDNAADYEAYTFNVEEYINQLRKDYGLTTSQVAAFKSAYENAKTMTDAINERNTSATEDIRAIESQTSQVAIAFATTFPEELRETQAEQILQMVENNITTQNGFDEVGLSVSDSLGTTASNISENMTENAENIIETLTKIYEQMYTEEEAEAAYAEIVESGYSGGDDSASAYSNLASYSYETAKASYSDTSAATTTTPTYKTEITGEAVLAGYNYINSGQATKDKGDGTRSEAVAKYFEEELGYSPEAAETLAKASQQAINTAYKEAGVGTGNSKTVDTAAIADKVAASYAGGIENGPVTFTGLAMLHGSPSSPEFVLNSDQAYSILRYMATTKPEFESNLSSAGDTIYDFGGVTMTGVNDPEEFFSELQSAMSRRYNNTKHKK